MRSKQRVLDNLLNAAEEAHSSRTEIGATAYDQIKSTIITLYGADVDIKTNVYDELDKIEGKKARAEKNQEKGGVKYGESTLSKNDFGQSQKKTPGYSLAAANGLKKGSSGDAFSGIKKSGAKEILSKVENDKDNEDNKDEKNEELKNEMLKIMGILKMSNDDLIIKHESYSKFRAYIRGLFQLEIDEKEQEGMGQMRKALNERGEKLNEQLEEATT